MDASFFIPAGNWSKKQQCVHHCISSSVVRDARNVASQLQVTDSYVRIVRFELMCKQ